MLQSRERQGVLSYLQGQVGFPFNESELSPGVRKRIGDLAGLRQQIDLKQWEVSQSVKKKSDYLLYLVVLIGLGLLTIVVIIGVVFLAGSLLSLRRKKEN